MHADAAEVNFNIWLTPDEANLGGFGTRDGGGLVVYTKVPPASFDFGHDSNNFLAAPRVYQYLEDSGAKAIEVTYRQNRCVLFQSDLFHETAPFHFKTGFLNRRINLTILFGKKSFGLGQINQ